jgi:hypothetical protein
MALSKNPFDNAPAIVVVVLIGLNRIGLNRIECSNNMI